MSSDAVPAAFECACHGDAPPAAALWRLGVGALIAANAMTISLALNTSQTTAVEERVVHGILLGLALASLAVLGWPLARNARRSLADRRISIEAMFMAGIVGALTGSLVSATTGTGDSYFEIVPILLVVYSLGQQLVGHVQARALVSATRWAPDLGRCLVVGDGGDVEEIPVSLLAAGQQVLVPPGGMIAADGIVASGEAFVREAEMTGEPFVVVKRPGMPVWAGTHCVDASLVVRATAPGRERRIDRICAAVEAARLRPSTLQAQADRMVARLLPLVLAVASITLLGWWVAAGWRDGLFNAMAVLLVACPCALGLATPLAVWVAIARMASRGLIVHGGESVEEMASVDTVVFDKTGTITEPALRLVDLVVEPMPEMEEGGLLRLVAAVQRTSRHPVAAAFRELPIPATGEWRVDSVESIPGAGLRAMVRSGGDGGRRHTLEIGTAERLIDDRLSSAWAGLRDRLRTAGGEREITVVLDGRVVIAAAVDESLRSTWLDALTELRRMEIGTVVLTGDTADRAGRAGADEVEAGLGPEDKLARVITLADGGHRVLFVGDGVNDAAAMAASHASIAVAGGADLASEVAGIVWHGADLRAVPWAIGVARRSAATIRSNLRIAVAYNLAGISLAAAGILHPVAAALLMACSSVLVTWRAMRPLQLDQAEAESRAIAAA